MGTLKVASRPDTLRDLLAEHGFRSWRYGDGFTEPIEVGTGCTCGVVYWDHIQHAGDCHEDCFGDGETEDMHTRHVIAVAVRARLATSKGSRRSPTVVIELGEPGDPF